MWTRIRTECVTSTVSGAPRHLDWRVSQPLSRVVRSMAARKSFAAVRDAFACREKPLDRRHDCFRRGRYLTVEKLHECRAVPRSRPVHQRPRNNSTKAIKAVLSLARARECRALARGGFRGNLRVINAPLCYRRLSLLRRDQASRDPAAPCLRIIGRLQAFLLM